MGDVWEEAFRAELRRRAAAGALPVDGDVVAVGAWWEHSGANEIDALVLAGRSADPVMAGEAKWAVTADAAALVGSLRRKVERGLRLDPETLRYAVCARTTLTRVEDGILALLLLATKSDQQTPNHNQERPTNADGQRRGAAA